MKKVYTITFHKANNYGAMLQAYALQRILKEKYETKIIDYNCFAVYNDYKILFQKGKGIVQTIKKNIKCIVKFPFYYQRDNNFNIFRKKMYFTKKYNNILELQSNPPIADAYICGSDQIWNPSITGNFDDAYYLNFGGKNIKKISYAASIGDIKALDSCKKEFFSRLAHFDSVSVREKDLNDFINAESNSESQIVADPSLLLTKEQWLEICNSAKIPKEKYIFAYSVGNANDKYYDTVNKIAELTGYTIVFFDRNDKANRFKYKKKSFFSAGPDGFVNLLYNSEIVVTTSFHGLALSLILNKNFISCLSSYPSRIISLLKIVNLSDRICEEGQDPTTIYNNKINWEPVNQKLNKYAEESKSWLFDSIDK